MYLLDTNVISELRRPRPHGGVVAWLRNVPDADLHLSAVTIGEIQAGAEIVREQDPAKAATIDGWLDKITTMYNVIPMGAAEFRHFARILRRKSRDVIEDAMIAATARIHELTIVTRNVRDFVPFGVKIFDPFGSAAP